MKASQVGLAFGVALGFAGAFGGIVPLVIVFVVGMAGLLVGKVIDGDFHRSPYLSGRGRTHR